MRKFALAFIFVASILSSSVNAGVLPDGEVDLAKPDPDPERVIEDPYESVSGYTLCGITAADNFTTQFRATYIRWDPDAGGSPTQTTYEYMTVSSGVTTVIITDTDNFTFSKIGTYRFRFRLEYKLPQQNWVQMDQIDHDVVIVDEGSGP